MNHRIPVSAALAASVSHDEHAAVRVDRAQTELRHGRVVAVVPPEDDAPLLLVAAIETLTPARWQRLQQAGAPRIVLTLERLLSIGVADVAHAQSRALPAGLTLDALRAFVTLPAGVAQGVPGATRTTGDQGFASLAEPRPATADMDAALQIAKRARLMPAIVVVECARETLLDWEAGLVLTVQRDDVALARRTGRCRLRRVSDAHVPIVGTEDCTLVLFREIDGEAEHVAIVVGRPDFAKPVPVRLHSACLTGDLLGSLRCDCGDQLRRAVDHLSEHGGVLLYLAQEGRGTGLANKLRAYRLQDTGLDTIDADKYLGFAADERDYDAAVAMLEALGIARIRLLTNSPHKMEALRRGGIDVVDRIELIAPVNPHNVRYLQTKRDRAGHFVRPPETEQD